MTPLALLAELDVRDQVEPLARICAKHGVEPLRVLDKGGAARVRRARKEFTEHLVAELGSESAAARALGRHPSTIHKGRAA